MTNTVLSLNGVGKCYRQYQGLTARLCHWLGLKVKHQSEYWANQDISFEVPAGQALAIIGQNGAGKSTLLKMITGTIRPTQGQIQVRGRISAMLELGLGFNPEFTGRQNAYLAGGLLGHPESLLQQLMPEIEAFAEIGDFFDQPLRVYSSGMQARLAFAVATAVRPDILIVDEILSVGDSYFQHRSFDRIRQFKEQGTSIILVTHGMGDVRSLCDKVILIDKGRVLKQGLADEVVDFYNAMIAARENQTIEQVRDQAGWLKTTSGNGAASITNLKVMDSASGAELQTLALAQTVKICAEVEVKQDIPELVLGLMLRDKQGHVIWGSNTWFTQQLQRDLSAGQILHYEFEFTCRLGPGSYSITTALTSSATHLEQNYEWRDNSLVFDVVNLGQSEFIGSQWLDGRFHIR